MKKTRLLIAALLATAVLCNTSYADDTLNKKLIKPLNTPALSVQDLPKQQMQPATQNVGAQNVTLPAQNAPVDTPQTRSQSQKLNSIKLPNTVASPVNGGLSATIDAATGKPVINTAPAAIIRPLGTGINSPIGDSRVPLGQIDPCPNSICITSINGKRLANIVFTPGQHYLIAGAHFGAAQNGAKVMINIDGTTAVPLAINAWSDSKIDAVFEISFKGKEDSDNTAFWIDFPNTPRVNMGEGQRGKFEAKREKQTITYKSIPQQAFVYEKGAFGEVGFDDNGYGFFQRTKSANQTIDSIKHQFTDKLKLNFIKSSFKLIDVNAEFGPTNTNGSRCDRCGPGSGGVYLYGSYGWEIKNTELIIKRAVWQNHISPNISMDWNDVGTGTLFGGPIGSLIGAAVGLDKTKGANEFVSSVDKLELVVEGPAGVNPIK